MDELEVPIIPPCADERFTSSCPSSSSVALGPRTAAAQPPPPAPTPAAARIDPYVARPRLLVLTDVANEPDDQMSLVRLLVYSNQFDIEGLVATTSTWMKKGPRPDVIRMLLDAYEQVQPTLSTHAPGFPAAGVAARRGRDRSAGVRHGGGRRGQDVAGRAI